MDKATNSDGVSGARLLLLLIPDFQYFMLDRSEIYMLLISAKGYLCMDYSVA